MHREQEIGAAKGWHHQLENERRRSADLQAGDARAARPRWRGVSPRRGAVLRGDVGNVQTYVGGGVTWRSGRNLENGGVVPTTGWRMFVDVSAHAVVRNALLGGNIQTGSYYSVAAEPFVATRRDRRRVSSAAFPRELHARAPRPRVRRSARALTSTAQSRSPSRPDRWPLGHLRLRECSKATLRLSPAGDSRAPEVMVTVPSPVRGGYRRGVSFALRVALAAAIVWWLIRRAGWEEVVATLGRADPWLLVAAAIALCCESAAKSWNWGRLLDNLGSSSAGRRAELWHVYMVASLVGSVLPSTASTDAMRGLFAQRLFGGRPTAHAAAIIINNLLVWIAACSLGLVCMACCSRRTGCRPTSLWRPRCSWASSWPAWGCTSRSKYYRWLWLLALRRVLRRRWYFLRRAIRRLADALLIFERAHVQFAPRAVVALFAAISSALVFAGVARAVGVELPLVAWGVIVPLVSLCGLLPISIAGVGGAQAVHVLLLAPFGVECRASIRELSAVRAAQHYVHCRLRFRVMAVCACRPHAHAGSSSAHQPVAGEMTARRGRIARPS